LPPIYKPALAADERITPADLAIFAVIAGAAFLVITYVLAGRDRRYDKVVDQVVEDRRMHYIEQHPKLDPDHKEAILRGDILENMTTEEVIASWGQPRRKEVLDSVGRVREQWVYYRQHSEYSFSTYYLIFVNGYLKKW